jgi:hypothetical protein
MDSDWDVILGLAHLVRAGLFAYAQGKARTDEGWSGTLLLPGNGTEISFLSRLAHMSVRCTGRKIQNAENSHL